MEVESSPPSGGLDHVTSLMFVTQSIVWLLNLARYFTLLLLFHQLWQPPYCLDQKLDRSIAS